MPLIAQDRLLRYFLIDDEGDGVEFALEVAEDPLVPSLLLNHLFVEIGGLQEITALVESECDDRSLRVQYELRLVVLYLLRLHLSPFEHV